MDGPSTTNLAEMESMFEYISEQEAVHVVELFHLYWYEKAQVVGERNPSIKAFLAEWTTFLIYKIVKKNHLFCFKSIEL